MTVAALVMPFAVYYEVNIYLFIFNGLIFWKKKMLIKIFLEKKGD
jgi:hypothetical protein